MEDAQRLRNLAPWHREFAEWAGDPWIWGARLRRPDELEQEAARHDSGLTQTRQAVSLTEALKCKMSIAAEATAAGSVESSPQCRQEIFAGDGFAREIHLALPPLRRHALGLTRNKSAADDLVQDTLARGMEKIHLWQPGTDLRAWLFALLRNLYVNGVRRAVREAVMVERIAAKASFACPPSQTKWLELRDLQHGLAQLREEQRSAVLLIAFEGGGYATAASRLDIPTGTVRSRLSRGRMSLRILTEQDSAPRARGRPSRNRAAA